MTGVNRLDAPVGLLIDRTQQINFRFEGQDYQGFKGDSIASALCANDRWVISRSFKYHRPRGVLTMAGYDSNTLVQLDHEPNVHADKMMLSEGLNVLGQNYSGSLDQDRRSWLGHLSAFLPVGFYYKAFYKPRGAWRLWSSLIRNYAGLGKVSLATTQEYSDKSYAFCDVAVIGGGCAGLRAAIQAANQGAEVTLIDENTALGGALCYARTNSAESESKEIRQTLLAKVAEQENILVLTNAVANGIYSDNWVAVIHGRRLVKLRAKAIVVATGAMEQPAVFRNNDLPGVMMGSAAQRLIRLYGVRPGRSAVVFTSNNFGYGVALDLLECGTTVEAVVDTRENPTNSLTPLLKEYDVKLVTGANVIAGISTPKGDHVMGVEVVAQNRPLTEAFRISCDLLCVSTGFVPSSQLLSHVGANVAYDRSLATFAVSDIPSGIFAAGSVLNRHNLRTVGDDGTYAGSAAATFAGYKAAGNIQPPDPPDAAEYNHRSPIFEHPSGREFVDFDEDLEVHDLRDAVSDGYEQIELLKRYSTLGMGPSQGRHSSLPGVLIASESTGRDPSILGRTTVRPPYTGVKFGTLAGRSFEPVRLSPMHYRHLEAGAKMMPAGLWMRPAYYGSGNRDSIIREEALSVRNGVGLIDVSTLGGLEIRGPDSVEFLNRMYTFSYAKQQVGRSRYVLMTDRSGVIVDDGVACRLSDNHFYVTATTSGVQGVYQEMLWYNAQWQLSVDVTNVTAAWCGVNIAGPLSRDVIKALTNVDVSSSSFPYMAVREGFIADIPARFMRVGFVGELGFEIHVPSTYGEALWDVLMDAGKAIGITPFGVEAQRLLRLEKGHIIIGQDTDGLTHPYEADMAWAISRKKPYFVGSRSIEIQAKRSTARKLVGFVMPDADKDSVPEECQLVVRDGDISGRVTSAAFSPILEKVIGLAYVEFDQAKVENTFTIKFADGRFGIAHVTALPFFDPEGKRQEV